MWNTTVDELIAQFRSALCALIPVAERVHMDWREPGAYDDWDHICEAIFRSIVIGSIEHAKEIGAPLPLVVYDQRVGSYAKNSFIAPLASQQQQAFVCFETETSPFDQSLFALMDDTFNVVGQRRVATADVRFVFCGRDADAETSVILDRIDVLL